MEYMPSRIYETYTADYTSRVHYAMRKDGQWFTRIQGRNRFGYSWSAWRRTTLKPEPWRLKEKKARLPKD